MFAIHHPRRDFAATRDFGDESAFTYAGVTSFDNLDPLDALRQAEEADSQLLRLVMGVACATLTLALISSLA